MNLLQVQDKNLYDKFKPSLEKLISYNNSSPRVGFLHLNEFGWAVVPIPNNKLWYLSSEFYAKSFYQATYKTFSSLYILNFDTDTLYQTENVKTLLSDFMSMTDHSYVLFDKQLEFLVIKDPSLYLLYVGRAVFVNNILPMSIKTARLEFGWYWEVDETWTEEIKEKLKNIHYAYMNYDGNLIPIEDPKRADRVREKLELMMDTRESIDMEWIKENEWIVIPAQETMTYTDAEWLKNAISELDVGVHYVVSLYENKTFITKPTFRMLSQMEYPLLDTYVMFDDAQQYIVFIYWTDFFLIGGSKRFVEKAVGGSLDLAKRRFLEYYADASPEQWALDLYNKYVNEEENSDGTK